MRISDFRYGGEASCGNRRWEMGSQRIEADKGNVERSAFNVQRAEGPASKAERERLVEGRK
jgi:hypothetical protein